MNKPTNEELWALKNQYRTVDAVAAHLRVPRSIVRGWFKGVTFGPPVSEHEYSMPEIVSREMILEAENAELRSLLRKGQKSYVADERIIQAIEMALDRFTSETIPVFEYPEPSPEAHHRQVLLLSDFHGGEFVDPGVINGTNSYSWEIMLERVDELIDSVLSHQKRSPNLTGLDVLFVGDMCSGENHEELQVTNQYPLAEQSVKMGFLQAEIIERLAPYVPNIRGGGVEGNHPRFSKAPAAKNPHNNGDWIANTICASKLEINQIPFKVERGSMLWEVAGRLMYVWHGDGVRSSMPGVPWGGIARRVNQIQNSYQRRIDHFVYGHFHQANVTDGGRIIGNGSLKGPDEWTTKNFGGGSAPSQLLITFDEKAQRMTDVRYITPTTGY